MDINELADNLKVPAVLFTRVFVSFVLVFCVTNWCHMLTLKGYICIINIYLDEYSIHHLQTSSMQKRSDVHRPYGRLQVYMQWQYHRNTM